MKKSQDPRKAFLEGFKRMKKTKKFFVTNNVTMNCRIMTVFFEDIRSYFNFYSNTEDALVIQFFPNTKDNGVEVVSKLKLDDTSIDTYADVVTELISKIPKPIKEICIVGDDKDPRTVINALDELFKEVDND